MCSVFLQSVATENCSQYFSKVTGDVRHEKAQTVQPQFTIYHGQLQPPAELTVPDHCTAVTEPEEMELHPSVTAAFVPESFHVRNEILDDINSTGWNNLNQSSFILLLGRPFTVVTGGLIKCS